MIPSGQDSIVSAGIPKLILPKAGIAGKGVFCLAPFTFAKSDESLGLPGFLRLRISPEGRRRKFWGRFFCGKGNLREGGNQKERPFIPAAVAGLPLCSGVLPEKRLPSFPARNRRVLQRTADDLGDFADGEGLHQEFAYSHQLCFFGAHRLAEPGAQDDRDIGPVSQNGFN
jgi:hypothetical protein